MITIPLALARSALDACPDAMLIIDTFGIVWFSNAQVSVLFGYAHDSIIGESIEILVPERFRAEHQGHREQYLGHLRMRPMGADLELFGRRRDGIEFPLQISLSPIEDVGRTLIAAAIRDISDRRRLEAELARAHLAASQQTQAIAALSTLLDTLRDIATLESRALASRRADFSVAALFDRLRLDFELEIEACAETARGDSSLVERILRTLLTNSAIRMREGSVRLCCRREPAALCIEVIESGSRPVDGLPGESYGFELGSLSLKVRFAAALGITYTLALMAGDI